MTHWHARLCCTCCSVEKYTEFVRATLQDTPAGSKLTYDALNELLMKHLFKEQEVVHWGVRGPATTWGVSMTVPHLTLCLAMGIALAASSGACAQGVADAKGP